MTAAQLQVATTALREAQPQRQPAKPGEKPAAPSKQQLRKQPRLPKSVMLELDKKVKTP